MVAYTPYVSTQLMVSRTHNCYCLENPPLNRHVPIKISQLMRTICQTQDHTVGFMLYICFNLYIPMISRISLPCSLKFPACLTPALVVWRHLLHLFASPRIRPQTVVDWESTILSIEVSNQIGGISHIKYMCFLVK